MEIGPCSMSIRTTSKPAWAQIWASSGDGQVSPMPSCTPFGLPALPGPASGFPTEVDTARIPPTATLGLELAAVRRACQRTTSAVSDRVDQEVWRDFSAVVVCSRLLAIV